MDGLPDGMTNGMVLCGGDHRTYKVSELCAIIHAKGAKVLAEYESDFYKGMPALTENACGEGKAYYVAARPGADFLKDFTACLVNETGVERSLDDAALPYGVIPMMRTGENGEKVVFVQNFTKEQKAVVLGRAYTVFGTEEKVDALTLAPYETVILNK